MVTSIMRVLKSCSPYPFLFGKKSERENDAIHQGQNLDLISIFPTEKMNCKLNEL